MTPFPRWSHSKAQDSNPGLLTANSVLPQDSSMKTSTTRSGANLVLLMRMRSQSPQEQQSKCNNTKHSHRLLNIYYVLCVHISFNLHNTARRALSSFCIDKGNKGLKKSHPVRQIEDLNQRLLAQSCAPPELNKWIWTNQNSRWSAFYFCFSSGWGIEEFKKRKQCQKSEARYLFRTGPTGLGLR